VSHLAIYYEHPDWFRPLFAELERREIPHVRIDAGRFHFDPARDVGDHPHVNGDRPALVFNRMSPSAWKRGRAHAILHTLHYLHYLDQAEIPVVNGVGAFTVETSKALQVALIRRQGLRAPRTRVVNHPSVLPSAARELAFPLVVKPNIGGSGAGIVRFDSAGDLEDAVASGAIPPSVDGIHLLQEFHPPAGDHIVRVETLAGRVLYGIRVHLEPGAGYDLCPADICRDVGGRTLESAACPAGAEKAGITVESFDVSSDVAIEVERLASAAHLDVGGIEYLESRRDGQRYYYDINALSNFVADPVRVVGFDPHERLVDYLLTRSRPSRDVARPATRLPRTDRGVVEAAAGRRP
jgi:hypothetical protein